MFLFKGTKLFSTLFVLLIVFCATNEARPPIFQNYPTCPGCQKRDATGTCQNTNTILNDGRCYHIDTSMQHFEAGPRMVFDLEPCTGCQKKDKAGICQNTTTILKDDKCYYPDQTMLPFDATPNTVVCPGCQRRDMMGICRNTTTILKDGKCLYINPYIQPFDALPDLSVCPGCQKKDGSGICRPTATVLADDKCYYIYPHVEPFDAVTTELPDLFENVPVCPGCQRRDINGICQATAAVLRGRKCYYSDPHIPPFDAGTTAQTPGIQTTAKSDIFMDLTACPGCQIKDLNGICRPTATVLRGDKCYYRDPRMKPFDAAKS